MKITEPTVKNFLQKIVDFGSVNDRTVFDIKIGSPIYYVTKTGSRARPFDIFTYKFLGVKVERVPPDKEGRSHKFYVNIATLDSKPLGLFDMDSLNMIPGVLTRDLQRLFNSYELAEIYRKHITFIQETFTEYVKQDTALLKAKKDAENG